MGWAIQACTDRLELLGRAGRIAARVAELGSPAREGLGKDGRTALTVAGAGQVRTGDLVVFCMPVAVAAAVVRRDGRVHAAGHLADHVRLGVAEQRLMRCAASPASSIRSRPASSSRARSRARPGGQ
jgi:hypothetical protein